MYEYMDDYKTKILRYPDMVVLVPISDLNPEPTLYYAEEDLPYNPKRPMPEGKLFKKNSSPRSNECPVRTYEEINKMINKH